MAHVPQKIYERIATAQRLYDASTRFPPPTNYAAEILLLISGWENVILAEKELEAWARGEVTNPKLLRDHIEKLNEVDRHSYVLRVIVGPPGKRTPAKEVYYRDGKNLKRLRELCMYGDDAETNDISKLFSEGWHTDSFARGLKQKIDWLELWLPLYEQA